MCCGVCEHDFLASNESLGGSGGMYGVRAFVYNCRRSLFLFSLDFARGVYSRFAIRQLKLGYFAYGMKTEWNYNWKGYSLRGTLMVTKIPLVLQPIHNRSEGCVVFNYLPKKYFTTSKKENTKLQQRQIEFSSQQNIYQVFQQHWSFTWV